MLALAAPLIKWDAVGKILIAGLVGGVGVVLVFGVGLLGLARAQHSRSSGARLAGVTLSAVCGLACLAAVAVGIYAMVNKPKAAKPKPKTAAVVSRARQRAA